MRRGGRRARRPSSETGDLEPGDALATPRRHLPTIDPLSDAQLDAIHDAALDLLERGGIEFLGQSARAVWRKAGAEVDEASQLVRIPRGLVAAALASAPPTYTLTPRNPAKALEIGGDRFACCLVSGPPNVHDEVGGRRPGSFADYLSLIRLGHSFDAIHAFGNQATAPIDLPAETRHLDTLLAALVESDKVVGCQAIGAQRVLDALDMMAIARGQTREDLMASPALQSSINVNSPRRVDDSMSEGLMTLARYGQVALVTPFTLMGAMTPVTLGAALIQQNAEALAGITLTQLVRPGAPVGYGCFTSNVDMRSGAPAFGTPENVRAILCAGQLARRYRLPYRVSNANAATRCDAQAAYESSMSLWAALLGGGNIVMHAAGWLEGGLVASFEKIVLDAELLSEFIHMLGPIELEDPDDSLAAILDVPPGGHFFGTSHTLERYADAFYQPMLSDWRNHEQWEADGAHSARERATAIWQERLQAHRPAPMATDVRAALEAFVKERKLALAASAA